eukprot:762513-Hanusia_phi.AAC.1
MEQMKYLEDRFSLSFDPLFKGLLMLGSMLPAQHNTLCCLQSLLSPAVCLQLFADFAPLTDDAPYLNPDLPSISIHVPPIADRTSRLPLPNKIPFEANFLHFSSTVTL